MADLDKVNEKANKLNWYFRNWAVYLDDAHLCDEQELQALSQKADALLKEFESYLDK